MAQRVGQITQTLRHDAARNGGRLVHRDQLPPDGAGCVYSRHSRVCRMICASPDDALALDEDAVICAPRMRPQGHRHDVL